MAIPNAVRKAAADATGDLPVAYRNMVSVVIQITEYSVLVLYQDLVQHNPCLGRSSP